MLKELVGDVRMETWDEPLEFENVKGVSETEIL